MHYGLMIEHDKFLFVWGFIKCAVKYMTHKVPKTSFIRPSNPIIFSGVARL